MVFPGFIDKARSEHIVKLASKYMHPSGLAYRCAVRLWSMHGQRPAYNGALVLCSCLSRTCPLVISCVPLPAKRSPPRPQPAWGSRRPGENADPSQDTRTSTGTFLSVSQDPDGVLGWVEERIAAATLLPAENGEVG